MPPTLTQFYDQHMAEIEEDVVCTQGGALNKEMLFSVDGTLTEMSATYLYCVFS